MDTKILYVLASSEEDIYLEQTLCSVYSLRQHHPNAHVILLIDDKTNDTLKGYRAKILDYISEKHIITLDKSLTKMRRSRVLKTTMREHVKGRFLYIDSDTLICSDLSSIDRIEMKHIAAVPDAHRALSSHYGREKLRRQGETLNFCIDRETFFFNSGVMLVNDNTCTHEFFRQWNQNWIYSAEKGINQDQPALLKTNIQQGQIISPLDGAWNCQIMYGFNYFTKAKIIHYFASRYSTDNGGFLYDFMNPLFFEDIKRTGNLTEEIKQKLQDPLACFDERVELIGGSDVDILNTHVYKLVRLIYHKHPRLFNHIQSILYKLNKQNKRKVE